MLTQLLEALAAAHCVPVEPKLMQVRSMIRLETCPVHALPVLFLDNERRCVSTRQARDHARLEKLLRRKPHQILITLHFPFKGIDTIRTTMPLNHALLPSVIRCLIAILVIAILSLLLAGEAVFSVVSCTAIFAKVVPMVWMYHDLLIVLTSFSVHRGAAGFGDGCRTTKVAIVEIVLIHHLWVDVWLSVYHWLQGLVHIQLVNLAMSVEVTFLVHRHGVASAAESLGVRLRNMTGLIDLVHVTKLRMSEVGAHGLMWQVRSRAHRPIVRREQVLIVVPVIEELSLLHLRSA